MPWQIRGSRTGIPGGRIQIHIIVRFAASTPNVLCNLRFELGAPHITTEPGGHLTPEQNWKDAAKIFYEELMPCVELAEKLDVGLLIEPEPELLIETFGQYLEFMDKIDSPAVGLNFDVGHAYCVSEDPQDWVAKMAKHTRHYHFEDIAKTRVHKHLIPGHGAIDFDATLKAIAATDYRGWLTVELYPYIENPDDAATEAFAYLTAAIERATNSNPAAPNSALSKRQISHYARRTG